MRAWYAFSEMANFWVAVSRITPDMGPLRFYSGSRRLGSLGKCFIEPGDDTQNRYPRVREFILEGSDGAACFVLVEKDDKIVHVFDYSD